MKCNHCGNDVQNYMAVIDGNVTVVAEGTQIVIDKIPCYKFYCLSCIDKNPELVKPELVIPELETCNE